MSFPILLPSEPHQVFGAVINDVQILILVMTVITLSGLMYLVNRTRLGRAMRATAENPRVAALMGVKPDTVISATFVIGAALAALAGVMYAANYGSVQHTMGFLPGLKAFTAAVFGGIGNLAGAMVGGVLLGLIESLGAGYIGALTGGVLGSNYQDIFAFIVLILVLTLRPQACSARGPAEGERVSGSGADVPRDGLRPSPPPLLRHERPTALIEPPATINESRALIRGRAFGGRRSEVEEDASAACGGRRGTSQSAAECPRHASENVKAVVTDRKEPPAGVLIAAALLIVLPFVRSPATPGCASSTSRCSTCCSRSASTSSSAMPACSISATSRSTPSAPTCWACSPRRSSPTPSRRSPPLFPNGLHTPWWVVIPLGALVAGAAGVLLGAPTLKLRGDYLAIVTLGFGEIVRVFMNNLDAPVNITNGPKGITGIDEVSIFGVSLGKHAAFLRPRVAEGHELLLPVPRSRRASRSSSATGWSAAASAAPGWRSARTRSRPRPWASTRAT